MDRRSFVGRAIGALSCFGFGSLATVAQKKREDAKPYRGPMHREPVVDQFIVSDMITLQRADLLETERYIRDFKRVYDSIQ